MSAVMPESCQGANWPVPVWLASAAPTKLRRRPWVIVSLGWQGHPCCPSAFSSRCLAPRGMLHNACPPACRIPGQATTATNVNQSTPWPDAVTWCGWAAHLLATIALSTWCRPLQTGLHH
jgi:hypothetical protein